MLGEEQKIIDKHLLAEVFRICHIRETQANQAKMFDAKVVIGRNSK